MIIFPCAKINLGLNVVSKREDGYHNLETVFYPIPLYDALEITEMDERYPIEDTCNLSIDGAEIEGDKKKNLVVKAYDIIAANHNIPRVHAHLCKLIPMQAGMGGGSSDAAFMIRLLNEQFNLNLSIETMEGYAAKLGADCAFFITSKPAYATGIGDILTPMSKLTDQPDILKGRWIVLVKPDVAVSTKEAYAGIKPKSPTKCCKEIVLQPIETWKDELINDFEESIFTNHPELANIKERLYDNGAVYAAMSGSGSTIFGLFHNKPEGISELFPDSKTYTLQL